MGALMRLFGAGIFNLHLDVLGAYAAGLPLLAALALAALKLPRLQGGRRSR